MVSFVKFDMAEMSIRLSHPTNLRALSFVRLESADKFDIFRLSQLLNSSEVRFGKLAKADMSLMLSQLYKRIEVKPAKPDKAERSVRMSHPTKSNEVRLEKSPAFR